MSGGWSSKSLFTLLAPFEFLCYDIFNDIIRDAKCHRQYRGRICFDAFIHMLLKQSGPTVYRLRAWEVGKENTAKPPHLHGWGWGNSAQHAGTFSIPPFLSLKLRIPPQDPTPGQNLLWLVPNQFSRPLYPGTEAPIIFF